jgi:DNA polymerase-3 subunit delta'
VVRKIAKDEAVPDSSKGTHGRLPDIDLRDDNIRAFLNACLRGRVPPLLFIGPEGAGKEHAAIDLARRVCCTADPVCELGGDLCESCRKAVGFAHPGIHLVYPTPTRGAGEKPGDDEPDIGKILEVKRDDFFATHHFSKKVSIRIARARAIIQRANTKPFGSSHNVFVVAGADLMREEAQNALLKVVEEPPEHCSLIFITENPDSILYTIRSRCQRARFSPLRRETLVTLLTGYYGQREAVARKIADLAQGSIQRAREMLDERDEEGRERVYEILGRLSDAPESWLVKNALQITRGQTRDNVARFLHEFATAYRDVMVGDNTLFVNRDRAKALASHAAKCDRKRLPEVLNRIIDTRDQILRRNLNMDAALVNLFLDIKQLGC